MECNQRNRNIQYAIFRDPNLKKLSEYLVPQSNVFLYFCDTFGKLKMFFFRFWTVIFYVFGRFVKTKYRTFLRMALKSSIYKSLIRPHLDQGDTVYDQPSNVTFSSTIESVQYNFALGTTQTISGSCRKKQS